MPLSHMSQQELATLLLLGSLQAKCLASLWPDSPERLSHSLSFHCIHRSATVGQASGSHCSEEDWGRGQLNPWPRPRSAVFPRERQSPDPRRMNLGEYHQQSTPAWVPILRPKSISLSTKAAYFLYASLPEFIGSPKGNLHYKTVPGLST